MFDVTVVRSEVFQSLPSRWPCAGGRQPDHVLTSYWPYVQPGHAVQTKWKISWAAGVLKSPRPTQWICTFTCLSVWLLISNLLLLLASQFNITATGETDDQILTLIWRAQIHHPLTVSIPAAEQRSYVSTTFITDISLLKLPVVWSCLHIIIPSLFSFVLLVLPLQLLRRPSFLTQINNSALLHNDGMFSGRIPIQSINHWQNCFFPLKKQLL